MNELTTDPLTQPQRARAEALHTSAAVLVAGVIPEPTTLDLADLAAYVIDGVHPRRHYDDQLPVEVRTLSGDTIEADQ